MKGKEYNRYSKKLIFEDEYINDKQYIGTRYTKDGQLLYELNNINGFGKEFTNDDDKLIFEGEYLNDKRNWKGKEYNYDGKLKFEDENLNGKRNRKGKKYHYDRDNNSYILFEGAYLSDKRWDGKGYDFSNNIAY